MCGCDGLEPTQGQRGGRGNSVCGCDGLEPTQEHRGRGTGVGATLCVCVCVRACVCGAMRVCGGGGGGRTMAAAGGRRCTVWCRSPPSAGTAGTHGRSTTPLHGLPVSREQGSGFRVQGSGLRVSRVQGSGFRVQGEQGSGFKVSRVQGSGTRVQGSGLRVSRVQGLGLRVQGSGLRVSRVQGSGTRVQGSQVQQGLTEEESLHRTASLKAGFRLLRFCRGFGPAAGSCTAGKARASCMPPALNPTCCTTSWQA